MVCMYVCARGVCACVYTHACVDFSLRSLMHRWMGGVGQVSNLNIKFVFKTFRCIARSLYGLVAADSRFRRCETE